MAEEKKTIYDIVGEVSRLTALANAYAPQGVSYQMILGKNVVMVGKHTTCEDGTEPVVWKEEAFTWEEGSDRIVHRLLREIADNLELDLKERRE